MFKRVLGGRSRHSDKAFNWRFVLDVWKLRNFLSQSRMKQTVDANANMSNPRQQADNARALAVGVSYSA